jgi:SAM-dependent methyltransferase
VTVDTSGDDLARMMNRQVREVPLFRALVRAIEAVLIRRHLPAAAPLLDLGCGDGMFTTLTLAAPVAYGLEPDPVDAARARRTGTYAQVHQAPAAAIPLADEACGLVLANSVLEHIPDLDPVLGEIHRVLRPGGWLLITAPNDTFGQGFGVAVMLGRVGLSGMAGRYRVWFNGLAKHHHLLSANQWQARLAAAGLETVHHERYLAPSAMFWFDLLHYVSAPSLFARRLLGRWHWFGRPVFTTAWTHALLALARRSGATHGSCVFLVARRPVAS